MCEHLYCQILKHLFRDFIFTTTHVNKIGTCRSFNIDEMLLGCKQYVEESVGKIFSFFTAYVLELLLSEPFDEQDMNFYLLIYLFSNRSGQSVMHGIQTDRFQLSPTVFANTTECPNNHCYNNNLPTGVQVGILSLASLFLF